MIESYFSEIESTLQAFPNIRSYHLNKKIYNNRQGYLSGVITFENDHRLHFVEVKQFDIAGQVIDNHLTFCLLGSP